MNGDALIFRNQVKLHINFPRVSLNFRHMLGQ